MPDTPKPGTPLPWRCRRGTQEILDSKGWRFLVPVDPSERVHCDELEVDANEQDLQYIVHACNRLPELEEKLAALEKPCVWRQYECEPVGGYYVGTCGFNFSNHEVRDWMKFCPYCGHPITEESEA